MDAPLFGFSFCELYKKKQPMIETVMKIGFVQNLLQRLEYKFLFFSKTENQNASYHANVSLVIFFMNCNYQ